MTTTMATQKSAATSLLNSNSNSKSGQELLRDALE